MNKLKLLIVDDSDVNRLLLRVICNNLEEFEIHEAVDGQDAVDQCEELHPDIILMDIMMPRMDGFQASKKIKERYPQTIITAVTTVADLNLEKKLEAAGMASYIRKPINKEKLGLELKSYAKTLLLSRQEKSISSEKFFKL